MRERRHGHRTALDGYVANLLGHHECIDEFLLSGPGA